MLKEYLAQEIAPLFKANGIREDLFAGFSVAIMAIPLALAIALASKVSPSMALTAAIIGGIIPALFGGARRGVSGPALSMTILIATCVTTHGLNSLLVIGLICGLLQLLCGIFKLGRYARLIPLPVVHAFTSAIAVILLITALPSALQISAPDISHPLDVLRDLNLHLTSINPLALLLALLTILIARKLPRVTTKVPALLVAVIIPTLIVQLLPAHYNLQFVGSLLDDLTLPTLPNFSAIENWHSLLISALAVFVLATLESLLSASSISELGYGDVTKPNQELFGQGIGNIVVALFGGIPITELLTRSQISIENGAQTRRAAIFHALFIFIIVYFFPSFLKIIPIPVLAGILISAAISMLNYKRARTYWHKDKADFLVYSITFVMLVFTNLTNGIQTGVMVALIIMIIRMLTIKSNIRLWESQQVIRISLSGNITALSFDKFEQLFKKIATHNELRFVIFEFEKLRSLDKYGAQIIIETLVKLQQQRLQVILHRLTKEQYQLIKQANSTKLPFFNTIAESEIKGILENHGLKHSANEVLKQGMDQFYEEYSKDRGKLISQLAKAQQPHTLLITCSDSRLDPNEFFSVGLGEIFVIRNVGNVVPPFQRPMPHSEAAAIEYALDHLNIRNIVICAHTECGAIKASLQTHTSTDEDFGLNNWIALIKSGFTPNWPTTVSQGIQLNVLAQVANLKTYPRVNELLADSQLTVSAWIYDVHTTSMQEWNELTQQFIPLIGSNSK